MQIFILTESRLAIVRPPIGIILAASLVGGIRMNASKLVAVVLSAILAASPALAAEAIQPPLPAGTHQAALQMGGVLVVLGVAAVVGAIAAIVSNTQGSSTTGTGS